MSKSSFRVDFLARRDNLSKEIVKLKSTQIFDNFLKLPKILTRDNFLLYVPVRNEVDTSQIIDFLQQRKKKIYLPSFISSPIRHSAVLSKVKYDRIFQYGISRFSNFCELEPGPYDILQPKASALVNVDDISVAVIPGVAFDKKGYRLGWGKGVYDKLLSDFKGTRVGLAYDFQLVDELPKEEHDLRMDIVVTDRNIFRI